MPRNRSFLKHRFAVCGILTALYLGMLALSPRVCAGELERMQHAVAVHPEDADLWIAFGARLYQLKRYGEAEWVMSKALEIRPKDPLALSVKGLSAYEFGRWKEAKDTLTQLYDFNPGAYSRSRIGTLVQREWWPATVDRPKTFDVLGRVFLREKDLQTASHFFEMECGDGDGSWQCLFLLGVCDFVLGHVENAERFLGRARALQPRNAAVLHYYARAKVFLDDQAMEKKVSLLASDALNAHAEAKRAELDYLKDESIVMEALRANPTDSDCFGLWGEYLASRGEFTEGINVLHAAIGRDWTNVDARIALARLLLMRDPVDTTGEAEFQLVRAISIDPDLWILTTHAPHIALLRDLLMKQGRVGEVLSLDKWKEANISPGN
jgi:tetratricopeptide (TPR) repeat protein